MTVHAHARFTRLSRYLVILLLAVSAFRAFALTEGDYTYTTNSAGQATITGFNSAFSGALSITNTLGGCNVVGIGANAFRVCTGLTSVTIPEGITSIGNSAFYYCSKIGSITIPSSVNTFGVSVSVSCTSLTNIIVNASNPSFSSTNGVMFNKGQTTLVQYPGGKSGSYTISDTVTRIEASAFEECSITSLTIGKGVSTMGVNALRYTRSLITISVAGDNTAYSSLDGVLYDKTRNVLVKCPAKRTGDYTIPETVTNINVDALYNCPNLTTITVPDNNPAYSSLDGVLFDKNRQSLLKFPEARTGNYTIPDSVTNIVAKAFGGSHLTGATVGDSITSIPAEAFYYSSLTNVTVGKFVVSIGSSAFYPCGALKSVYFLGNAPSLGTSVFSGANNATVYRLSTSTGWPAVPDLWGGRPTAYWDFGLYSLSVNGGAGSGSYTNGQLVAVIANPPTTGYAFSMWTGATQYLSSVTASNTTVMMPPLNISLTATYTNGLAPSTNSGDYIFFTNNNAIIITGYTGTNGTITVPAEINGFPVMNIATNAFASRNVLYGVEIPDSITNIGNQAFLSCANLASITFGTNLKAIGSQAFDGCVKLTTVVIPKSVLSIGLRAFRSCNSVTSIAVEADNPNYSSVDGVLFNKGQTKIIQYPGGNTGSYAIPSSVTVVGYAAFQYCYGLSGITIPDSVTRIEESSFYGCSGLSSVNLNSGLGTIGNQSFRLCSSLHSVTIPGSVTSIVYSAFSACNNMTGIYFEGNAPVLGASVFTNSNNLTVYRTSIATGWPTVPDPWGGRPTALWGPIYYALTVNAGTGTGSYMNGHQVAVTAYAPQPGYVFDRWTGATQYLSSVTSSTATVTMPAQDIALTATYKGNTYTVAFNAQGGTAPSPASKTVTYASAYGTLATTARAGYFFKGWHTNTACSGSAVASTSTVVIASNHTLYAKWTEQTTTLTPVAVPYSWINQYPILLQVAGGNYDVAALIDLDLDGHLAWQEYVAGTVPTDKASVFRTSIAMIDGAPIIVWTPDLGSARVYTVEGCTNLTEAAWGSTNATTRFFKVRVNMP